MISFRFHLVSVVAVFLALGLGVLSGTTVLNRGIVAQLERQTERLATDAQELRGQVTELQAQADQWGLFGEELIPYLLDERLEGRAVVLITQEGTDEAAVAAVQEMLERAGASILTLLQITDRMALPTDVDRQDLATAIGTVRIDEPETLKARAAVQLADQLAFGASEGDVLGRLMDGGFVANLGRNLGEAQVRELSQADAVVVVAGGLQVLPPRPERFLIPFVEAAAESGIPLAAAEPLDTVFELVGPLRSDDAVTARIVTQDNVDQVPGTFGLVLALGDLLDEGRAGHYGVKDRASGVIPPPSV
ncbi:MAG: copper transporter [Actinomycetota bacterium]